MIWWMLLALLVLLELDTRLFRVKFHRDSRVARLIGVSAFTLGRHVFMASERISARLRHHEGWHVEQYRRYTLIGFTVIYWWHQATSGYQRNPLEQEARATEDGGLPW